MGDDVSWDENANEIYLRSDRYSVSGGGGRYLSASGTACGSCGGPSGVCSCLTGQLYQQPMHQQPMYYNPPSYSVGERLAVEVMELLAKLTERIDSMEAMLQTLVLESIKKDPYGLGESAIES